MNVLAKIQGLRVSARTSSFHFKGKDTTIAEIGRALKVSTVDAAFEWLERAYAQGSRPAEDEPTPDEPPR